MSTVLARVPLRTFPLSAAQRLSCPRCPVISASSAVWSTFFVRPASSPPGGLEARALLACLLQQRLRELLLIDDFSCDGIYHLCGLGHSFAFGQATPFPAFFLQSRSVSSWLAGQTGSEAGSMLGTKDCPYRASLRGEGFSDGCDAVVGADQPDA